VVHSLVRYRDGSLLAQMGVSDMKIPIAHALGYPDRILSGALNLDLTRLGRLDFMPVDLDRFPAISLARSTMDAGHAAAVVFNAANEEAVTCFLEGKIRFTEIYPCVEKALSVIPRCFLDSLEDVILFDADVRRWVKSDLQRCVSC
jgi:1-deoxy-D-xylulose-5-phosphate reductoisomerase